MPCNDPLSDLRRDLTVQDCLVALRQKFAGNNIETADLDARLLVQATTGIDHAGLILNADHLLSRREIDTIEAMSQRRLNHEPVSRILGVREFYGRDFHITGDVLDPRPDTETLVDLTLSIMSDSIASDFVTSDPVMNGPDILDIGTGTGAIIISLLCELPHAKGVATDISPAALKIARQNSHQHGVADRLTLQETAWCAGIEQKFDIIVSNPPYIARSDIDHLALDVKDHDPHLALDGGPDGLDAYRALARQCPARLKPGGVILLEVGFDQAEKVADLFKTAGFIAHDNIKMISPDLANQDRVVTLIWPQLTPE